MKVRVLSTSHTSAVAHKEVKSAADESGKDRVRRNVEQPRRKKVAHGFVSKLKRRWQNNSNKTIGSNDILQSISTHDDSITCPSTAVASLSLELDRSLTLQSGHDEKPREETNSAPYVTIPSHINANGKKTNRNVLSYTIGREKWDVEIDSEPIPTSPPPIRPKQRAQHQQNDLILPPAIQRASSFTMVPSTLEFNQDDAISTTSTITEQSEYSCSSGESSDDEDEDDNDSDESSECNYYVDFNDNPHLTASYDEFTEQNDSGGFMGCLYDSMKLAVNTMVTDVQKALGDESLSVIERVPLERHEEVLSLEGSNLDETVLLPSRPETTAQVCQSQESTNRVLGKYKFRSFSSPPVSSVSTDNGPHLRVIRL